MPISTCRFRLIPGNLIDFRDSWKFNGFQQLTFIADQLAPTWSISPQAVETEIVVYSTFYHGFIGDHDFNYANYHEFSDVVHQFDYFYNRVTPASINGSVLHSPAKETKELQYPELLREYNRQQKGWQTADHSALRLFRVGTDLVRENGQFQGQDGYCSG